MTKTFNSRRGLLKATLGLAVLPLSIGAANAGYKYRKYLPRINPIGSTGEPPEEQGCVSSAALNIRQLVPAYFWDAAEWDKINSAKPADVIFNPNSGPALTDGEHLDYNSWAHRTLSGYLNSARVAGHTLFGYVQTEYGTRPVAEVLADVRLYVEHWGITSFFLDESTADEADFPNYQTMYNLIKAEVPGAVIIFNPGHLTDTLVNYFELGTDARIVTYENYSGEWESRYQPAWHATYRNRSYVLAHGCSEAQQQTIAADSIAQGYRGIYCTDRTIDSNPWATLPSYWGNTKVCTN